MAKIRSGISTDELTIDTLSKAARVTQYNSSGEELFSKPSGVYTLPINMGRLDGTAVANDCIWAMYNNGTKTVRILGKNINTGFDGTAAATSAMYNFIRFTTAATTGGVALTVAKNRTSYAASSIGDARQIASGALGVVGISFISSLAAISNPRQVSATQTFTVKNTLATYDCIELIPGEGLAIRLGVNAVAGDVISGQIVWIEI